MATESPTLGVARAVADRVYAWFFAGYQDTLRLPRGRKLAWRQHMDAVSGWDAKKQAAKAARVVAKHPKLPEQYAKMWEARLRVLAPTLPPDAPVTVIALPAFIHAVCVEVARHVRDDASPFAQRRRRDAMKLIARCFNSVVRARSPTDALAAHLVKHPMDAEAAAPVAAHPAAPPIDLLAEFKALRAEMAALKTAPPPPPPVDEAEVHPDDSASQVPAAAADDVFDDDDEAAIRALAEPAVAGDDDDGLF